jgi:hypothetical protein
LVINVNAAREEQLTFLRVALAGTPLIRAWLSILYKAVYLVQNFLIAM